MSTFAKRGGHLRQISKVRQERLEADEPTRKATAEREAGVCEGCHRQIGTSAQAGDPHHVFRHRIVKCSNHPALRAWLCNRCHMDGVHGSKPDSELADRLERSAVRRLTGAECPVGEYPIDVVRGWFREGGA